MRVLLIIPPGLPDVIGRHEDTSGMGTLAPPAEGAGSQFLYPPHTVAAAAGAARAAGLEVAVLDGSRASAPMQVAAEIAAQPGDMLAVLVSQGTTLADANFLRLLRRADRRPALVFGTSAHLAAAPLFGPGLADAALLGEPEGAFAEAARRTAHRELAGALWADEIAPAAYRGRGRLADLDALPFPAWDLTPWQPYNDVSVLSSRGCPDGCAYCAYTLPQGAARRSQRPERTVAELAWIAEVIRPRRVQMRDPVFAADRARVTAICEQLIARRVGIQFNCESRPEHFDDDLLRLLLAAGAWRIKIGLESGDPALLVRLGRARDVAAAERMIRETQRVARTCAALGLRCQVYVMAGLPGQDAASLARTEAVLRRLPAAVQVVAKPYQPHAGAPLTDAPLPVAAGQIARLEGANQTPGLTRRVWHFVRTKVGFADKEQKSGGAGRSTQGRNEKPHGTPDAKAQRDSDQNSNNLRSSARSASSALNFAGLRVFLTGGNGFVGGHVAAALVEARAQVVALVRPGSPLGQLAGLPVKIVRGDLTRPAEWEAALAGCAVCFHVAALYADAAQVEAMYAVNVEATSALLAACAAAGVRRVVHTSTIGTVGRPPDSSLPDETTPFNLWEGASHYVRSKYLGEQAALSWNGAEMEVVIVKPTAPVGACDARPTATGRRIAAALHGEVTRYPAGGVNHVPVIDVAAGHLLAALHGAPGQTYILGHRDGNLDHAAFLRLVAEAAGTPPLHPPRQMKGVAGPDALTADPSRAILELGLPQSDLRAAFAEEIVWMRSHQ